MVFASRVGNVTQIFAVDLDRELVVAPRVEVNGSFNVDLPVTSTEVGAVLASVPPLQAAQPVPSLRYGLVLNPAALFVLPSAPAAGGVLRSTLAVPNNPWLSGQELVFQGVRLDVPTNQGDFTRHARARIF